MSLTLTVDGTRWRCHLRTVLDETPGLVPVAKGNGYGFTLGRLARKADWLGVDTLAVGTYEELPEVANRYAGDLLVLTPWRPFHATPDAALGRRVIHTVSRPDDLAGLLEAQPDARFVLELETSSHCPTPGAHASRSYVLAAAKPKSLAGSTATRYASPSRRSTSSACPVSFSCSAAESAGLEKRTSSTLSN